MKTITCLVALTTLLSCTDGTKNNASKADLDSISRTMKIRNWLIVLLLNFGVGQLTYSEVVVRLDDIPISVTGLRDADHFSRTTLSQRSMFKHSAFVRIRVPETGDSDGVLNFVID